MVRQYEEIGRDDKGFSRGRVKFTRLRNTSRLEVEQPPRANLSPNCCFVSGTGGDVVSRIRPHWRLRRSADARERIIDPGDDARRGSPHC